MQVTPPLRYLTFFPAALPDVQDTPPLNYLSLFPATPETGMREAVTEGLRIRVSSLFIPSQSKFAENFAQSVGFFAYRSLTLPPQLESVCYNTVIQPVTLVKHQKVFSILIQSPCVKSALEAAARNSPQSIQCGVGILLSLRDLEHQIPHSRVCLP